MENLEKPPSQVVIKKWKNEFFGKEKNGKKYDGFDYILAKVTKETYTYGEYYVIEVGESMECEDFTRVWVRYDHHQILWDFSVDDFAKLRQFIDAWNKWCRKNDFDLEIF